MEDGAPAPFGSLLRDLRLAAGLTQERLAELAGLGRRTIQSLERGEGLPQRASARRLAGALALAPADDALVLPTVAGVLGAPPGPAGDLAAIAARLAAGRVLGVLDNAEHLPGAGSVVARLLGACPGLRVLATSRVPLRVYGERELP